MDGETVLAEAAQSYRYALGERLIAAYALGSLAHGGFSPLVSDIDLGLVVSDPVRVEDAATIQAIAGREKAKGSPLHERISVFWGTPATLRGDSDGGRFPPLDRLDLIESGRRLFGSDEEAAAELLRKQMVPLYLHFIDDHIRRLSSLAETRLVDAFAEWRDRLVG